MLRAFLSLGLAVLLPAAAPAAPGPVHAFTGATVFPVAGPSIPDAVLLVQDGKILAVGPRAAVPVPAGATVHEHRGRVVIPGLVDTHTHLSGAAGADSSSPMDPNIRVLDGVDIRSPQFVKALAGGITTVNQMSGSGHLMSGQTIYLKIRRQGTRVEEWMFCGDPLTEVCGGMKMANGTNPIDDPPFPQTRAKSAALVRELYLRAQEYAKKKAAAAGDASKLPPKDLALEALVEILDGRRQVHFHSHRHDDIATALRIAKEFGFTPVIHHGSEAWRVAEELAAAGAPVSLTVVDTPGGKEEALLVRWETAAILRKAGVEVAVNTDDWITDSRMFLRSAALTVRGGLSQEEALRTLTLAPAKMLDLDHRLGSLEVGKDADFVVLSGAPFATATRVLETWVEGRKVFDLSDPADAKIASGGYGALRGSGQLHLDHGPHGEGAGDGGER